MLFVTCPYVSLVGTGLRDLDPQDVHVCADTEESWPIVDWSRSCVSLEQLVSSFECVDCVRPLPASFAAGVGGGGGAINAPPVECKGAITPFKG